MGKRLLVFFLLSGVCMLVTAHEFWLEPLKFYYQPGERAKVYFKVGDDFIGDIWKGKADRIMKMEHHSGNEVRNIRGNLKDSVGDPVPVVLASEGTHMIVMESNPAFIELDGQKFTQYLQEDGLDEILYQRKKEMISDDSASEFYSRHTKLILQAGSHTDENYRKIFNLPVEIIPLQNPALLKKGDRLSFRILFQGKPLFGAKVKVWNRYNNRVSVQNIFTEKNGIIETHVSNPGFWMVSVVKMVPSTEPKAMYRSYWGTMVFGVRE